MFSRICLLALLAPALAGARDWAAHPAVVERPAAETLFALGDIHGDYDRLVTLLKAAKIVDDGLHWSAGRAVFVVTGDMIDKGPKSVEVLHLMARLQIEAKQAGGEAIPLAGNHEAEFLAGPDAKKAADFIADLKARGYKTADVAACRTDLGEFLCGLPFAAKVGDFFFSHGGNSAGRSLGQIQADITAGVDRDGYRTPALIAPDSLLEARLGEGKDQWVGSKDEPILLERYAKALGVNHIVQGHQHNEIRFSDGAVRKAGQLYNYRGLLFLIDCGMSREIDDTRGAILKVTGGRKFEAIYPEGQSVRPL